ncbi:MAG: xanthine dehydrogenase small subunit [Myxococcota bacterium]
MDCIRFTLNGRVVEERSVPPTLTLLQYLRYTQGLTGTKEGCAEGDCGACTVAILDADAQGGPAWRAVNSCLVLLPMLQGKQVVSVEGIAQGGAPHPAQESLVQALGSQCGYCTPGVVMSMFEACYRKDLDQPWKLDDQMCGNLCRCTGYRPIKDATKQVAGTLPDDKFRVALKDAPRADMKLSYQAGAQRYFTPTTVEELGARLAEHPEARIVCGGTDVSLEVTKRYQELPLVISVEGVPELRRMEKLSDGTVRIGATATLSDVEAFTEMPLPPVHRMLRYFASRQIKNRGTVGGNLCNASPIGDMAPVLLSLDASVELTSRNGTRRVPLKEFFLSYRKTALQKGEFLSAVLVPPIPSDARASAYKVSKRRELDISAVAAGFLVRVDGGGLVVEARLGFGGMAATPARARQTEAALVGKPWNEQTVEEAALLLDKDFAPISDHRGSSWYRATVAKNLLRGFFVETQKDPVPALPQRPTATVQLEQV